jgi:hypothetical protein
MKRAFVSEYDARFHLPLYASRERGGEHFDNRY